MADIVFIAVIVAFFAVAAVVVKACERVIGPDAELTVAGTGGEAPADEELAA